MSYSILFMHIKAGTDFDVNALTGVHGSRFDSSPVDPDNIEGDWIGTFRASNPEARKILEAVPGITVLPPLHRPIKAHHAAAFSHVSAQEGEIAYDLAERLHDHHQETGQGLFWLHPEATHI